MLSCISQTARDRQGNRSRVSPSVSVPAQDGIATLRKARTRLASSLSSLPKVAVHVGHNALWLAVSFDKFLYFCSGFSSRPFTAVLALVLWQQSLVVEFDFNWEFFLPVPGLLELYEAAYMLDWSFCSAHPWLAFCQSTSIFFLNRTVEWILMILHRTEIHFDLPHLMSYFHWWQVQ